MQTLNVARSLRTTTAARRVSGGRSVCPSFGSSVPKPSRGQLLSVAAFEGDKKKLTREDEPEQYWSPASERAGANPMKDPLAVIGVVAILFPFLFVLVAIATGAIDTSVYR